MLKPEIERLSDVDLAVEVVSKEEDFDRARVTNYDRVEELAMQGHRFRNFLEQEVCWYEPRMITPEEKAVINVYPGKWY